MKAPLLKDLPSLRRRAGERYPLVNQEMRDAHPALAEDFAVLDQDLLPRFYEADEAALQAQNAFRLGQLVLILGGATATSLGAVQAALGGGVTAIGVAEALVAGVLSFTATLVRAQNAQREYFTMRLVAERLRGEYFRFLGRLPPYDAEDAEERRERLRAQVAGIEAGEEKA